MVDRDDEELLVKTSHIFFDLDNTLLDESKAKSSYLPKLFDRYGTSIHRKFDDFVVAWTQAIPRYYQLYLEGEVTFIEQRQRRIVDSFANPEMSPDLVAEVDQTFSEYFQESWQLFDGLLEYLSRSSIPKSIITNGNGAQQRLKVEKLGITGYFQNIFTSEDIGFAKPDARIFKEALRAVGVTPGLCLMVGDSWEIDIIGAAKVGMRSIWLSHSESRMPASLDGCLLARTPAEMVQLLQELEER